MFSTSCAPLARWPRCWWLSARRSRPSPSWRKSSIQRATQPHQFDVVAFALLGLTLPLMQVIATRWSHAFFLQMANGLKPGAHREPIKAGQWHVDERADPALQELEGVHEGL